MQIWLLQELLPISPVSDRRRPRMPGVDELPSYVTGDMAVTSHRI